MERYDDRKEIVLEPIDSLQIRFYLIEETNLELWVLLTNNYSPRTTVTISESFAFKRNVLEKNKRFQISEFLYINLSLFIKKTETHFDVRISILLFPDNFEIITRKDFNEFISLNSIYFGETLEDPKNNLINNCPMNIFHVPPHQELETNDEETTCGNYNCSIF